MTGTRQVVLDLDEPTWLALGGHDAGPADMSRKATDLIGAGVVVHHLINHGYRVSGIKETGPWWLRALYSVEVTITPAGAALVPFKRRQRKGAQTQPK